MSKIVAFSMVTADGYFEGVDTDISWHRMDEEVNDYMIQRLKECSMLIFGRKSFDVLEKFWTTSKALQIDRVTAGLLRDLPKLAFSEKRTNSDWENTRFSNAVGSEMGRMKSKIERDVMVLGSAALCHTLDKHGWIDEYHLMVHALALGSGIPFFKEKTELELLKVKIFENGNVLLCYRKDGSKHS